MQPLMEATVLVLCTGIGPDDKRLEPVSTHYCNGGKIRDVTGVLQPIDAVRFVSRGPLDVIFAKEAADRRFANGNPREGDTARVAGQRVRGRALAVTDFLYRTTGSRQAVAVLFDREAHALALKANRPLLDALLTACDVWVLEPGGFVQVRHHDE